MCRTRGDLAEINFYCIIISMILNQEKYQNTILYLCQNLGGQVQGKKKLAKLLYFVDFDMYENGNVSITGDMYKKLPMGPFPSTLEDITSAMVQAGNLTVIKKEGTDGYLPTEVYSSTQKANVSIFDENEIKMLHRVVAKYGKLTGKQLEDLSHAEAPFVGTNLKEEIPYELTFYRGTDFSDL
jgi:uncharacterized phage-associated protein